MRQIVGQRQALHRLLALKAPVAIDDENAPDHHQMDRKGADDQKRHKESAPGKEGQNLHHVEEDRGTEKIADHGKIPQGAGPAPGPARIYGRNMLCGGAQLKPRLK